MHACIDIYDSYNLYGHVGRWKHTRNVRNNMSRRGELGRMKMWQCQRQGVVFAHYSTWRSCSSSMAWSLHEVLTVIYTRGMVDYTKQIRKSCNVRRLFHWHEPLHMPDMEVQ